MSVREHLEKGLRHALWFCVWVIAFVASSVGAGVGYSYATAQRLAPGEMPEGPFYVALLPGADGAEFDTAELRRLPKHVETFLLPRDQDEYVWRGARPGFEKYRVLERTATSQLVELQRHTSDYDFFSRYQATKDAIIPVYSRIMGPGTGLIALPIGALLTYVIVRLLQWAVRAGVSRVGRSTT